MVNCATCGKKLGFFSKCWVKGQDNKKIYYCSECYKKIWVCARCDKNLTSFKKVGYFTDENGMPTYYCPDCFEKEDKKREDEKKKAKLKKKVELEKFKSELMNDELILRFSEEYPHFCLSLKKFRKFKKINKYEHTDEYPGGVHYCISPEIIKIYNSTSDFILSDNLSKFKTVFSIEWKSFSTSVNSISNQLSEIISKGENIHEHISKKRLEYLNFLTYDFLCFEDSIIEAFLNFLEIISRKYKKLSTSIFIDVLDSKTKEYLSKIYLNICNNLKTEDELIGGIIEHTPHLIESNQEFAEKYLKIFLDCAKTKKLTNCKSVKEFREKIKEFQKTSKLKDFETNLLKSSENTIGIEDIDLMNGFEFEDFLSKLFRNMDYKVVQTKLSGDQGADLIIERNNKKTVVQAKCYSGKLSNKAIQEVVASIKYYKANAGMVVTNSYFTPSAVKLADSNEVRLIDRNKLKELIEKYMN